jgi:hypothetical protein
MYTLQGKTRPTHHVRFPHQSTYARRMLLPDSSRTWKPFTSHQQSWAGPLLLRKRAPDTIYIAPTDRSTGSYLVSLPNQKNEVVGAKPNIYRQPTTRLTRPISPPCDQYIQYLIVGANPLVLNRHMRGLQPWRCRHSTYHSPTFPTSCLHFSPKGPARSPV